MRISDWSSDVCSSDLVRAFRMRYPLVTISLSEMTSKEQITAITNREIDIGFFRTPTPLKQSAINFTYLTEDALVVAMHAEHPQIGRASCRERVCQYV